MSTQPDANPALPASTGSAWDRHTEFREGYWWAVRRRTASTVVLRRCKIRQQALRVAAGLTQAALAKRLGISQSYLCKIEEGSAALPQHIADRIEAVLSPNSEMNPAESTPEVKS